MCNLMQFRVVKTNSIIDHKGKKSYFICMFIHTVKMKMQSLITAFSLNHLKHDASKGNLMVAHQVLRCAAPVNPDWPSHQSNSSITFAFYSLEIF